MKNIAALLSLCFAIFFSANSFGQTKLPPMAITHLTGDFYVYTNYHMYEDIPFPSNSMYLVTDEGVVMFDTPWDSTEFQPILDSIEKRHHKKVILCIAGHFHADRTAGFEYYNQKGIKTFSSKMTYDLCKANNEKQAAFYFSTDTTFKIGNHAFQVYYPGPGHTKDNIVIWFPDEKIIYGGCFIKSTEADGLGNIGDANLQAWPASVKNVLKKFPSPNYVIPGHFSWQNKTGLQHTLKLLKESSNKNKP